MAAFRTKCVRIPSELSALKGRPCYLPDKAEAEDFDAEVVQKPKVLSAGIATSGPLASLFFLGLCEEQALVVRVKDKGMVVITGCGHPTVEVILEMVRRLSDEPLYAIAGGLHFPVTESRFQRRGIQLQMLLGTGKPPWQRIGDEDLTRTINHINEAAPKRVLLSAHDTCDHALDRLVGELDAETMVLEAGRTYTL
jgi:7,8-dihydropterin-6-yl-methyl-4-(beta-D-ribofuranosyl)aminobenzene 5'-phosphate synthase